MIERGCPHEGGEGGWEMLSNIHVIAFIGYCRAPGMCLSFGQNSAN